VSFNEPEAPQLGTSIVRNEQGKIIGICNMTDGSIMSAHGKQIGIKRADGQIENIGG
jgi:hypothetical protein